MSEGGNAAALRERWGRPDRAGRAGSGAGPAPSLERAWTETSTGNRTGNRRCPCLRCGKDGRKDSREEGRSRRDPTGSWERLRERALRAAGTEGTAGTEGRPHSPGRGCRPGHTTHSINAYPSPYKHIYNIDKCVCVCLCVYLKQKTLLPLPSPNTQPSAVRVKEDNSIHGYLKKIFLNVNPSGFHRVTYSSLSAALRGCNSCCLIL